MNLVPLHGSNGYCGRHRKGMCAQINTPPTGLKLFPRLLYGVFIMSSMASLAYDIPPMFSITQDLDIELLDEEKLWEATNREDWNIMRMKGEHGPNITVRNAFTHLVLGKEHCSSTATATPMRWTAFSTSMIMHAVNIYMWNLMQCSQSFGAFAVEDCTASALKTAMVSQTEATLPDVTLYSQRIALNESVHPTIQRDLFSSTALHFYDLPIFGCSLVPTISTV
jgi:hypothetical protein